VADRIGEMSLAGDQLLALRVIFERRLGQRTDQNLEETRIDASRLRRLLGGDLFGLVHCLLRSSILHLKFPLNAASRWGPPASRPASAPAQISPRRSAFRRAS